MYILDKISRDEKGNPLFFYILKGEQKHYFSVEKFLPDISEFYIPNHIFEQYGY